MFKTFGFLLKDVHVEGIASKIVKYELWWNCLKVPKKKILKNYTRASNSERTEKVSKTQYKKK